MMNALELIGYVSANKWAAFIVAANSDKPFSMISDVEEETTTYIKLYNGKIFTVKLCNREIAEAAIVNSSFDALVAETRESEHYNAHKELYRKSPYDGCMDSTSMVEFISEFILA